MNNPKSKGIMMASIGGIGFIAYNAILFAICGFQNHGPAFWLSYVFVLVAVVVLVLSGILLKSRNTPPKDWLLGYPVLRHCTIYIMLELIFSIAFMAWDYRECPWAIAFSIQMLLLAVSLVFIISCFHAKEITEDIQNKVKEKTSYIRLLLTDVEMIVEKSNDTQVKRIFLDLAEKVRYSDPMSNEALSDIENRISDLIREADSCIILNDTENAIAICKKTELMLLERNKKCKALK